MWLSAKRATPGTGTAVKAVDQAGAAEPGTCPLSIQADCVLGTPWYAQPPVKHFLAEDRAHGSREAPLAHRSARGTKRKRNPSSLAT